MKCIRCSSEMQSTIGDHPYDEAGLAHVVLRRIEVRRCESCGESSVMLRALSKLHRSLALELIHQKRFLLGCEVSFLRKVLDFTPERLATTLGSDVAFVTSWEAKGMDPKLDRDTRVAHDRLLRLAVPHYLGLDVAWPDFREIKDDSELTTRIEAVFSDGVWAVRSMPLG